RIAGPFAAIRFDTVDDAENQIYDPAAAPEEPNQREEKYECGRRRAGLLRNSVRRVKDGGEHREEENGHRADAEDHVGGLPDQRLQRVVFHEFRILFHKEDDERADEAAEDLK